MPAFGGYKREPLLISTGRTFYVLCPLLHAVMPQGALVDYEPCVLASVLPGATLRDAFRRRGCHAVPGALLQQLADEGPEARRARWRHVPPQVLARQPPWLV